jgi:DNA helicase HerA-like ATPase
MKEEATAFSVVDEEEIRASAQIVSFQKRLGHVVTVSGSQAVVVLDASESPDDAKRLEIGTLVKILTPVSSVVGIVAAMSSPMPTSSEDREIRLLELTLVGEIFTNGLGGQAYFRRGVSNSPALGDAVTSAGREELACVYVQPNSTTIDIGSLFQDRSVPARLIVDELFGKHFLIVGTTGSGKSCAVTSILRQVMSDHTDAHIVVLDVHNEYADAFGEKAERIHPSNLRLPFWLLNFQELCAAFTGSDTYHEAEVQILSEAILSAKRRKIEAVVPTLRPSSTKPFPNRGSITVDTPCPFHLSDVLAYIDEQLGKLERRQATLPYMRLKNRIGALIGDARYGFMFESLMAEDVMSNVLGRIFRVPADGKPITVIELAAVPAEILDVVISLIARLAFDLAVWSDGSVPMLLVCEEAHRYAPAADGDKFMPTRQALARIAKEGRKYGLGLGLVTQRPSELDSAIISQCSTIIALRLSTDRDKQAVRANTHEGALELIDNLPLLGDREAIILGQAAPMPMRIRFHELVNVDVPKCRHLGFSHAWKSSNIDRPMLDKIVSQWRTTGRNSGSQSANPEPD